MSQPTLCFRPLRPAVAGDGASSLELLITITPPPAESSNCQRPPLNLALVIDRSGSMHGQKLSYARKAARFLAGELTSRDRLAIVSFDDEVTVLVPSRSVNNPQLFFSAINAIDSGGGTALFDGWVAGATQVANHLDSAQLNRVLLLSDGQANRGLTDQGEIAEKVSGLTANGISTSAFGLGHGFDEDLMSTLATAGDGTLAFIESPGQLADLYACELQGLAGTCGRRVSLGLRAKNGAEILDLLNDLPQTSYGNHQLPNLRSGQELNVGVRLKLPSFSPNQEICSVRLAWDTPGSSGRQKLVEHLTMPVRPKADLDGLEIDTAVAEQLALLEANRVRRRVIEELDRGDLLAANSSLAAIVEQLAGLAPTELIQRERRLLADLQSLMNQDRNLSRKRLRSESLRSSTNVWEGGHDAN